MTDRHGPPCPAYAAEGPAPSPLPHSPAAGRRDCLSSCSIIRLISANIIIYQSLSPGTSRSSPSMTTERFPPHIYRTGGQQGQAAGDDDVRRRPGPGRGVLARRNAGSALRRTERSGQHLVAYGGPLERVADALGEVVPGPPAQQALRPS